MIVHFEVSDRLPAPARTALQVVQSALGVNRKTATELIHSGALRCQGRIITQTHLRFAVGDSLEIDYVRPEPQATRRKTKRSQPRFEVVHDDPCLLVVNKPAGLLTVPSRHRERNTLKTQIDKWLASQGHPQGTVCIQRLDRGVSGLLVFAKDRQTAQGLRDQFALRKPKRKYVAIVKGRPDESEGTIKSYLATDKESLQRYSVQSPDAGELAITHFRVIEHWRDVSLCEVRLETGRRNQIRVHFAEAGHPILGDPRYCPHESGHPHWPHKRLALHAEQLGFRHPSSGEMLLFTAPWPQEFRDLRRKLRKPSSPA